MRSLSLLIKPASSLCNMRCRYCFYEDASEHRMRKSMGIMSPETTEQLVRGAFDYIGEGGMVSFAFQGGEPTLAGADYFRHLLECVEQNRTRGSVVRYAIQTNGYSLEEELLELLRRHRFLVGISVDGEKPVHDGQRPDRQGKGTWMTVKGNLHRLQRAGLDPNALCVVTRAAARNPQKTYRALKELGLRYHQYIPCLDPLDALRGSMADSLTPKAYGKFLCGLFDCWYADWKLGQYVSVGLFEDFVFNAIGRPCVKCSASGACGQYLVIEGDGSAYPCDFYAVDQWCLGSIWDRSVAELFASERAADFAGARNNSPEECADCPWAQLCRGGCRRDWVWEDGKVHNYYCAAYRIFFPYARDRLGEIARAEYLASRR